MREDTTLSEYRCDCGKLLFKGLLLSCKLEIKCKRCGAVKIFRGSEHGIRSFMFAVDGDGVIKDACEGIGALELNREYVIGKNLFDILPLAKDAFNKNYQIRNNTLLLRDCKVQLESYVVPTNNNKSLLYRVFSVIKKYSN